MSALVRFTDGQARALAELLRYVQGDAELAGARDAIASPLPSLTPAEWSAVSDAYGHSPVRDRAIDKVRDALTTPRTIARAT